VKRFLPLLIFVVAVIVGGVFWTKSHSAASTPAAPDAKPAEEEAGPKVSRNTNGNVVITMTDEVQGNLGIQVTNPAPCDLSPEVKGYGRVQDPSPLAALMTELATAEAAAVASSNELSRLKTLAPQGNASARAVQTAEAAALRDQLTVQSAKDRLTLSWGKPLTEHKDLPAFIQSLTALDAVLVRIDLPVGSALSAPPATARIATLSGQTLEAEFLGRAPAMDPQMQGQGYLFLVSPNKAGLTPGQAVTGYLKVPGQPLPGVVVPRAAVVRAEGAGWVYVLDKNGAEAFTRTEIPLDHPTDTGWFITRGLSASSYIVVNGAQQLLSLELKGQSGE
jgi:hypothetical protein